jgi:hypothetical protein
MEYRSSLFKAWLAHLDSVRSMNRPGKMNDNVHMESFFHATKSDILYGVCFDEDREIAAEVRNYMPFYSNTRLHSSLAYVPPATYEKQIANARELAGVRRRAAARLHLLSRSLPLPKSCSSLIGSRLSFKTNRRDRQPRLPGICRPPPIRLVFCDPHI